MQGEERRLEYVRERFIGGKEGPTAYGRKQFGFFVVENHVDLTEVVVSKRGSADNNMRISPGQDTLERS